MSVLGPIDLLFLQLEKRRQPMHVGGLFLLTIPDNAPANFVQHLIEKIKEEAMPPVAPFNQLLRSMHWTEDNSFDLDHHFRHIALPKPGRIRELLSYISQEHSALLDRAKPMWELHVIEGIEGNRVAIYGKIHHALVDGVAAMKLLERSFSASPTADNLPPPWAVGYGPRPVAEYNNLGIVDTSILAKTQKYFGNSRRIATELTKAIGSVFTNPEYVSSFAAPKSILNNRISASRRFAAQSYALSRLQLVAAREGCTLNDAILAMCGGALRAYLLSLNALPTKSLVAMVPVNIRDKSDEPGNHISMILATLATNIADPIERLHSIKRSTEFAKERFGRMTQSEIMGFSGLLYAGAGLNLITGVLPTIQAFNIIVSNVPGPKHSLYWNGAKLDAMYPVSVIMDGQSMNITLTSYNGNLDVGILACRKTLPKIQILLKLLEQELFLLEKG